MILIVTVSMLALCAAGPEDEIVKAEKSWAAAVVARDYAALERILHGDLIYAHSTGVIETKGEYVGKLKSNTQRYDVLDHQKTTVKVHGNSAVAHSTVIMKGQSGDRPFDNRLMMIHLWVKESGQWRLAAHQTTQLDRE